MRLLYAFLLRLHPRRFRERFSEEMRAIFEEAPSIRFLADVCLSLFRQWVLRPDPQPAAASVAPVSGGMFHTLDTYKPRRTALIQGAALSAILFWVAAFAATQGGHPFRFMGASRYPHSGLLSVSELEAPTATVRVPPTATDPWLDFASRYFKSIYVLNVLDADQDFVISESEISAAPAALRKLDLNGDSRLTAEECGLKGGSRELFMHSNPILAALDTDRDSVISVREIRNAAAALKRLDLNADGRLLPVEVAPESVAREILLHGK